MNFEKYNKKDNNPLVSVVIPVYNVQSYLCEAIDSVIHQSYVNLEILIVDDGSTDGSGDICDIYAIHDSRIRVFHQVNKGLSHARNVGLDYARGKIIAFLDPDDSYHSQMIRIMVDEMMRSDSEIVICDFSCQKTEGLMRESYVTINGIKRNAISNNKAFHSIVNRSINTAPWNKLYKASIWEDLRFPEGRVCEGTYLIFDIFDRAKRVSVIHEELIMHRNRQGSICNTISVRNMFDYQVARNRFYSYVKNHTPNIFTMKELKRLKYERLYEMITAYFKTYSNHSKKTGIDKIGLELLIRTGDVIEIQNECAYLKLIFIAIHLCPCLCYLCYTQMKMLKKILLFCVDTNKV